MKQLLYAALVALLLTSCSSRYEPVRASTSEPAPSLVFTPIATLTPGSGPTTVPRPSATTLAPNPSNAPAYQPFSAATFVDNLALRKGPGYLFTRIGLLPAGTALRVLARSRGGEWAMVQTSDGRVGWAFVQLLDSGGHDWASVPPSEPLGAQLVTGVVRDEAGVPISGIQFAFTQGDGSLAPRTDAMTDQSGTFYAYFPQDTTGKWYLSFAAIACSSNIMDAGCNPKNGREGQPEPQSQYITLPLNPQIAFQFVWK